MVGSFLLLKQVTLRDILKTLLATETVVGTDDGPGCAEADREYALPSDCTDSANSPSARIGTRPNNFATARNIPRPMAPYIESGTDQYLYALHVCAGMSYTGAAKHIGVNPRTAERWRQQLCKIGEEFFGRPVEYFYVANYATSKQVRQDYADMVEDVKKEIILNDRFGVNKSGTNDSAAIARRENIPFLRK